MDLLICMPNQNATLIEKSKAYEVHFQKITKKENRSLKY
jgi:hypothetical protein